MVPAVIPSLMPCGYNSTANDDDEANGGGVNEPVWPTMFDSFLGLVPLIITDAMMAQFDECADLTIPSVRDEYMIPYQSDELVIRGRR